MNSCAFCKRALAIPLVFCGDECQRAWQAIQRLGTYVTFDQRVFEDNIAASSNEMNRLREVWIRQVVADLGTS